MISTAKGQLVGYFLSIGKEFYPGLAKHNGVNPKTLNNILAPYRFDEAISATIDAKCSYSMFLQVIGYSTPIVKTFKRVR